MTPASGRNPFAVVLSAAAVVAVCIWLWVSGIPWLHKTARQQGVTTTELASQYMAVALALSGTVYTRYICKLSWLYCILFVVALLVLEFGVILLLVLGPEIAAVGFFALLVLVLLGSRWLAKPISRFFAIKLK